MEAEMVTIKVEPQEDFAIDDKKLSPELIQNKEPDTIIDKSDSESSSSHDSRNFTCLLCEVICENRDHLRSHLKTYHASNAFSTFVSNRITQDASLVGTSTYMNYRYTCTLCGAKFKSLRSYLSHNMSHRSIGSLRAQFEENSMTSALTTGKHYLPDYIEADDGYPGTFTCIECNTVFTQRDSYAMHMMMRAMNETCQHVTAITSTKSEKIEPDEDGTGKVNGNDVSVSPTEPIPKADIPMHEQQKCLEDVTSSVDQDEYLKSVLDKVFTADEAKRDVTGLSPRSSNEDGKQCKFCSANFGDQDSLAMHVMSAHAQDMVNPIKRGGGRPLKYTKYSNWISQNQSLVLNYSCKFCGEIFLSRDNLAMHVLTHAHRDDKKSDFPLNNNSLKRSRAFELDPMVTANQRAKILRRVDHLNNFKRTLTEDNVEQTVASEQKSDYLFCKQCNITFYLRSEFDWHLQKYHNHIPDETDDTQPLCLKMKKFSDDELTETLTVTRQTDEDNMLTSTGRTGKVSKQRRNSFSFGKSSHEFSQAPKRPLSADDCSSLKIDSMKAHSVQRKGSAPAVGKCKQLSSSNIVPNLNALSFNEQRIIYSVFGKNLDLNKVKNGEKQSTENETIHEEIKRTEKLEETELSAPADLTITKSPTPSISGETSSDDTTSGKVSTAGNNEEKDSDEKNRALKSDLGAPMCKYCDIVFFNKAIYYLHMGLHNVNDPWQCNVCGKICTDAVDFAAHVIHM